MDPELLGRVGGLGRGTLLGFSLVVTEGEIIGIDETRKTFRFWLATIGSIALGLPVYFGLVYFTEPVLFRINSLLSFVTFLVAPFLIFVFLLLRVPLLLRRRIEKARVLTIRVARNDVSRVEFGRPNRFNQRGHFSVRTKTGGGFGFWSVGGAQFDYVLRVLQKFCSLEPQIALEAR